MEKERYIRQCAFDRIDENNRRIEILSHDTRMMSRMKNVENQRKSILGAIGKSQKEIAMERKSASRQQALQSFLLGRMLTMQEHRIVQSLGNPGN